MKLQTQEKGVPKITVGGSRIFYVFAFWCPEVSDHLPLRNNKAKHISNPGYEKL